MGDADEAHEAVHEAFIAAWAALGRYDPGRPFLAWLRTIAINKARDRGRRMAFRRLIFGSGGLEERGAADYPDSGISADRAVIEHQDAARLGVAISKLPAPVKEALLLTAFEGLTQQEAAEILGVTAKAVETRAYRARRMLALALDPDLKPNA